MSQFENLILEEHGDVLLVRMNRPEQANAFDRGLSADMALLANRLGSTWKPRAIVLTGAGKAFSAGGDVKSMAEAIDKGPEALSELLLDLTGAMNNAISRMLTYGAPLVAAVDGAAAGAGFSVACACDLVIASPKAVFVPAYVGLGFTPDVGLTYHLPRIVGPRKAWEIIARNCKMNATEALDLGLITELYEGEKPLVERALEVAQELAQQPAGALRQLRQLLAASYNNSFHEQAEREACTMAGLARNDETMAQVKAVVTAIRNS